MLPIPPFFREPETTKLTKTILQDRPPGHHPSAPPLEPGFVGETYWAQDGGMVFFGMTSSGCQLGNVSFIYWGMKSNKCLVNVI